MRKELIIKTNESDLNTYEFKFNGWMSFIIDAVSEREAFTKFFKTFSSAKNIECECKNNKQSFNIIDENIISYSVC